MGRSWSSAIFRWPYFDFSEWSLPSSIFRWPEFDFSGLSPTWAPPAIRWPDFDFVDRVIWTFITVFESLVLAAMLCFFFVFCGCCSL